MNQTLAQIQGNNRDQVFQIEEKNVKNKIRYQNNIQGGFFDWSAQKMTKCQPLKEFLELVLPKND